jgi:hypothetical protein
MALTRDYITTVVARSKRNRKFARTLYHEDRCHLTLGKDTPDGRVVTTKPSANAGVVALAQIGGLQHRYEWREAA